MNDLIAPPLAGLVPNPPSMPSLPSEVALALGDRGYVFDGSPAWSAERALHRLALAGGAVGQLREAARDLREGLRPVPRQWLGDRLTLLWTMFMASRTTANEDTLTVWMAEYLRLLSDLPHDIAATAIDRAVQSARHGFIPSVGEIRAIGETMLSERTEARTRVDQMLKIADGRAMGPGPVAAEERA